MFLREYTSATMGQPCKKKIPCLTLPGCMAGELLQPQGFAVTIYTYKISVYVGGRGHQSYEMGSGIAIGIWRIIPGLVSGYIGSIPFISRKKAIWRGPHHPMLRGID